MKKKTWKCCGKRYEKWVDFIHHRRRRHPDEVAKSKHTSQMQNYGQTGKEFERTLRKQKHVCASCGQPAKNISLSQDHSHSIVQIKIFTKKEDKFWVARSEEFNYKYRSRSRKKAKRMVLLQLKRKSRRGALCWLCNTALRKVRDNYRILLALGEYLKKWEKKQGWDFVKKERLHA